MAESKQWNVENTLKIHHCESFNVKEKPMWRPAENVSLDAEKNPSQPARASKPGRHSISRVAVAVRLVNFTI